MNAGSQHAVLGGVRVADFSRVLAGPFATMTLADFGADVVKIESPRGDETRAWFPPLGSDGQSAYFDSVNRNKRSVVCDFTETNGLATARRLAHTADVIVENFRPGVMASFGLDYDSVRVKNPSVVYCSITGFGSSAKASELTGYDLLVQAMSGLMSITGEPASSPTKVGVALVDVLSGQNAVAGILLALRARDAHPDRLGQRVDVNLFTTALAALVNQAGNALATGVSPERMGNAHPSISPYELYQTADAPIVIAVGNDRQFRVLCDVLGIPEIADDGGFATNPQRVAHRRELARILETALANATRDEWVARMRKVGLPVGPVNGITEALELAASLGLEPTVRVTSAGRSTVSVRSPIELSGMPATYTLSPPLLGEHENVSWLDDERQSDEQR